MKRWNTLEGKFVERPDIDAFLEEVIAVCKKHGLSIAHEETERSFTVEQYSDKTADWLRIANINSDRCA